MGKIQKILKGTRTYNVKYKQINNVAKPDISAETFCHCVSFVQALKHILLVSYCHT